MNISIGRSMNMIYKSSPGRPPASTFASPTPSCTFTISAPPAVAGILCSITSSPTIAHITMVDNVLQHIPMSIALLFDGQNQLHDLSLLFLDFIDIPIPIQSLNIRVIHRQQQIH